MINADIAKVEASHSRKDIAKLKAEAKTLEKEVATAKTPKDAERMKDLSVILAEGGAGANKSLD